MIAITILAPILVALASIYIIAYLFFICNGLWENDIDQIKFGLVLIILPILVLVFMILFYIYYM